MKISFNLDALRQPEILLNQKKAGESTCCYLFSFLFPVKKTMKGTIQETVMSLRRKKNMRMEKTRSPRLLFSQQDSTIRVG